MISMLSVAVISGLFYSRFTRPSAKIIFSDQVLHTNHLEKRCLVFRLANTRVNKIINAKIHMTTLMSTVTPEGTSMRILNDLKLTRDFNSIFFLNWVVSHEINDQSPLYNMKIEDFEKANLEFLISFSGTDQTFSQPIHADVTYNTNDIIFDRQFKDMVIRNGNDILIELDQISQLKN